jgi:hypothetical protein
MDRVEVALLGGRRHKHTVHHNKHSVRDIAALGMPSAASGASMKFRLLLPRQAGWEARRQCCTHRGHCSNKEISA